MVAIVATIKEWLSKALALLDHIINILRVKLAFLKQCSPTEAPKYWIIINGTCCIVTAMFFLLGWLPHEASGYQFCEAYYVPYNLVICIVWLLEAALWMLFDEESEAWHKLGEVALAVFFVLDSFMWLYGFWVLEEELKKSEIILYTAIDFMIYLFYLVLAIRAEAKAEQRQQQGGTTADASAATDSSQKQLQDEESGAVVPPSDQPEAKTDFKLLT